MDGVGVAAALPASQSIKHAKIEQGEKAFILQTVTTVCVLKFHCWYINDQ
jgi:hypothetical protein